MNPPTREWQMPGWRLVPVEPTREMFKAADKEDDDAFIGGSSHGACIADQWAAMLAAAPKAPPMPEPNQLHTAIRAIGYTTHGQTAEIVDLVLAQFAAQGLVSAKE